MSMPQRLRPPQFPTDPGWATKKLLPVPQVLELLGVCCASFYEIVKRGELPVVKLGDSSRVRASDLHQYVDGLPQLHAGEAL